MFVVGLMVLPATEEDALPLERQGPDDDLVRGAGGPTHLQVRLGPGGKLGGAASELVKRLPQELGTCPTNLDHRRLAAATGDRGDPAHLLDSLGVLKSLAVGAEGGSQPRGDGGTRTGKRGEHLAVGVFGKQGGDLVVALGDGPAQRLNLRHHVANDQAGMLQHHAVCGQWQGLPEGLDLLAVEFLGGRVVGPAATFGEPLGQLPGRGPLQFRERRELGQEGQAPFGVQIAGKELEGLRIGLFNRCRS